MFRMNRIGNNSGDFVMEETSKEWLANHKERIERERQNPQLIQNYYKALDDLYRFAKHVSQKMWPHTTTIKDNNYSL